MELMVVVILVSLLALLASPSLMVARNDRAAFDYARQYQQIVQRARANAAGTGAAHLVLLGPGVGGRGYIHSYIALDGEPKAPLMQVGPNPVSSCKQVGQWDDAALDPLPTTPSTTARFLDASNINRGGINVDMDLNAKLCEPLGGNPTCSGLNTATAIVFIAICITPSGVTYAAGGDSALVAIENMRTSPPFNGVANASIQRHNGSGTAVGLRRHVIVTGGGAARLRSD